MIVGGFIALKLVDLLVITIVLVTLGAFLDIRRAFILSFSSMAFMLLTTQEKKGLIQTFPATCQGIPFSMSITLSPQTFIVSLCWEISSLLY
jgi:hypothetical protein